MKVFISSSSVKRSLTFADLYQPSAEIAVEEI